VLIFGQLKGTHLSSAILLPPTDLNRTWLHRSIYYLAAGFIFAAVTLRSLLVFRGEPFIWQILALLAVWLLAFLLGSLPLPRLAWLAALLTGVVAVLPLVFLYLLQVDFFASLFVLVGMQAMRRYPPWAVWGLLGLATLLVFLILMESYGVPEALALALVYAAGSAFVAAYIWSTRKARTIQDGQQALLMELQEANRKLESLARQQQQLAAGRERQRLARELHDSVTQTIFSMTLTTQSALLLQERDPQQVAGQLDRLDQLARSALSEMQVLISRLAPETLTSGSFVNALQRHLDERLRLENLSVALEVEGDGVLDPVERAGLFRIAQEALNNIVKHAGVTQAVVRLHLADPFWMEVEDHGAGFDPGTAQGGRRMGLAGMGERAAGVGWTLRVESSPGNGTCIRVEKDPGGVTKT
jgi:signal transduction histidine kinase